MPGWSNSRRETSATVSGSLPIGTRGSQPPYALAHDIGTSTNGAGSLKRSSPRRGQSTVRSPNTLISFTRSATASRTVLVRTGTSPAARAWPRTATSVRSLVGKKSQPGSQRGWVSGSRMSWTSGSIAPRASLPSAMSYVYLTRPYTNCGTSPVGKKSTTASYSSWTGLRLLIGCPTS
jgi:hypothetical protein